MKKKSIGMLGLIAAGLLMPFGGMGGRWNTFKTSTEKYAMVNPPRQIRWAKPIFDLNILGDGRRR